MSVFGGIPFPVQFFLAFVIVLGLIGATAWAVRRFGAGRIGGVGMRGRQPRLGVVDYASVDGRRRLLLLRRDNVEHLVMIGGPTDVVVESNIVRATAAPRDIAIPRAVAAPETLPHTIPLPDNAGNGSWPLQPEPAAASGGPRPPRGESPPEPAPWPTPQHAHAPARAHRDTLAALADELSAQPVAPPRSRPQASARPHPAEPRHEPRVEPRQESRLETRHEARVETRPAAEEPEAAEPEAADQSLVEMAHRLEAALRKPNTKPERSEARSASMPRASMPAEHAEAAEPAPAPTPSPAPRAPRGLEAKVDRTDAKHPGAGKKFYDSLEQEMASLLGRPTSKH